MIKLLSVLLLLSSPAYAFTTTVRVTATVVNTSDITDGVITGVQPVQSDVIEGYVIWSF